MSATPIQTAPRDPAVQAVLDSVLSTPSSTLLERARSHASEQGLRYAGGLTPAEAWALVSRGDAVLVDVRTAEERKFVGRVPDTPHAAWQTGPAMIKNPRFLRELESCAQERRGAAAVPQWQTLCSRRGSGRRCRISERVQCAGRL